MTSRRGIASLLALHFFSALVVFPVLLVQAAHAQDRRGTTGSSGTNTSITASLPPERLDAVERFVEKSWKRLGLPAVAVSVASADSVILALGYGEGTLRGEPVTAHTPFHVGSVTKTFTAAATAQLARGGILDLDAPVESYLSDFTLRDPFIPGSITLRHLVHHRSGLAQWSGHDKMAQREGRFDHLAPSGPPGEGTEYSSLNFIILGRVLQHASGESYGSLLHRILFDPLDMQSAFVEGTGDRPANLAQGHQSWFGIQRETGEPSPPRHLVPAGFVGASAHDLGRYGGMLVGGGRFGGRHILDPQTVEDILGPRDAPGAAMGWGRTRMGGALVLLHKGNARTSSARMRLLPDEGLALTVLSNTNSGPFFSAVDDLMDGVHGILMGEPEPRPWPKERAFKVAVLAGTVLSIAGMARQAGRWSRAGYPVRLDGSANTLGRLAVDVGLGGAVLLGVPRLVGVPLSTLVEYFPDLGIALAASASAGILGGFFRAFTRSAG